VTDLATTLPAVVTNCSAIDMLFAEGVLRTGQISFVFASSRELWR